MLWQCSRPRDSLGRRSCSLEMEVLRQSPDTLRLIYQNYHVEGLGSERFANPAPLGLWVPNFFREAIEVPGYPGDILIAFPAVGSRKISSMLAAPHVPRRCWLLPFQVLIGKVLSASKGRSIFGLPLMLSVMRNLFMVVSITSMSQSSVRRSITYVS